MKKSDKKSKPIKQSKSDKKSKPKQSKSVKKSKPVKVKGKGDVYYSMDTGKLKEAPKGSVRVMSKEEQMKMFPKGKVYIPQMYYDEFGVLKTAPKGSVKVMSRAEQLKMFGKPSMMIIPDEYGQKSLQKFVELKDDKGNVSIQRVPMKTRIVEPYGIDSYKLAKLWK